MNPRLSNTCKLFKLLLAGLLFFGFSKKINAQAYPKQDIDLQAFVRNVIGIPTENLNYEELFENLAQYYYQPINLNTANRNQLANLYALSNSQIENLIAYRNQAGALLSVYELQAIEGFDMGTIYKILPFVTVPEPGLSSQNIEKSLQAANQYLIFRNAQVLEQKRGYTPLQGREKVRYLGTPGNYYLRYKAYHANDISLGLTLEKDDGEKLAWQPKKYKYGADFSSFHLQLKNKGHWKNISLGDYQMQFGQGLVLAAGFYLGKGSETILGTKRNSLGVRPYSSLIEQNYFRGLATTYQLGNIEITGFASATRRSANYVKDKTTGRESVSSLDSDGYHRTQSELDDMNILQEKSAGGNIKFTNTAQNFQLELTGLHTNYSLPLIKQNRDYNLYEFKGENNHLLSLSHSWLWRNINMFGELARSKSGGIGTVQGLIYTIDKKSDVSVVYRNYERHFHSYYANAFGENSRNINEKGLYLGYKFSPSRWWIYTSSLDFFKFPFMKFGVDGPSKGFEFLQRLSYKPSKTTEWYLQYREQHKQYNAENQKIRLLDNTLRRNLALHYEVEPGKSWNFSTTMQASNYKIQDQDNTYGMALIQNATYKKEKWRLNARLAYFKTDNYDNRQYAYEQDVLYAFSFPAYYGHGLRQYAMLTLKAIKNIDLQMRWSQTYLFNATSIGSGLDEIAKPHKTELKFQAIWQF